MSRIRLVDDHINHHVALYIPYARRPQLIAALSEARDNTQSRSTHELFTLLICLFDPKTHLRASTEGPNE